jgi:hypothetical protein
MSIHEIDVIQTIKVTVDETKFTSEFMEEFRQGFYPFETLQEHVEHLAQLYARGLVDDCPNQFIEGYGPAREMGIKFTRTLILTHPAI